MKYIYIKISKRREEHATSNNSINNNSVKYNLGHGGKNINRGTISSTHTYVDDMFDQIYYPDEGELEGDKYTTAHGQTNRTITKKKYDDEEKERVE